jgi:hypothetical protein
VAAAGRTDGAAGAGGAGAGAGGFTSSRGGGATTLGAGVVGAGVVGALVAAGAPVFGGSGTAGLATGGADGAGAAGFATGFATGGATGAGLAAGGGGGASTFLRIAAKTSPGLEIFERSIFVLISSLPAREALSSLADVPVPCPEKCLRTRSASSNSSELEWVFFSVTPTCVNTSRIALLLTSSSLAKSLIRILLIRLLVSPIFR